MTNVTGFTETLINAPKNDFRGAEEEVAHLKTTATALPSLSFFNPICATCTQTDYDPFTASLLTVSNLDTPVPLGSPAQLH
jgi:hypothetical protein